MPIQSNSSLGPGTLLEVLDFLKIGREVGRDGRSRPTGREADSNTVRLGHNSVGPKTFFRTFKTVSKVS